MNPHKYAYKIPVVHRLQEYGYHATSDFCQDMRHKVTQCHEFLEQLSFSDDATFHISGQVNGHVWEGRKFSYYGYMKQTPQNYISASSSGGHIVSVFSLSAKQQ